MKSMRLRFAPSPTGPIHLGNLRTALFNWLAARKSGGTFILRIEDTDPERSKPEFEQGIKDALLFLGLDWDEGPDTSGDHGPYRQSERASYYENALDQLLDIGFAYPCFCTPEELDEKRQAAMAAGDDYSYDRACLADCDGAKARMADGEPCSIRFKMPDEDIVVDDLIRGSVKFPADRHTDLIIRRTDGSFTYNFCCAVDDVAMGITQVFRGEDHLSNTPKQIAIFNALGETPPEYGHMPLIHSPEGGKLKKRDYGEGVNWFWDHGYMYEAMFNYLSLLGWSHPDEKEFLSKDEIVDAFSVERISKSPSKFDLAKLNWLNEQHMRALTADELYTRAKMILSDEEMNNLRSDLGEDGVKSALYELRDVYSNLKEVPAKFDVFGFETYTADLESNISVLMEEREQNTVLLEMLAKEYSGVESIPDGGTAMHLIKSAGGKADCKGKALFHPVRVALTGRTEGFELKRFLSLLGRERILERTNHVLGKLKQGG